MESRPRQISPVTQPPSDCLSPPVEEGEQVMSEIHLGCPSFYSGPHISRFVVSLPPFVRGDPLGQENADVVDSDLASTSADFELDEDGDLVLNRRIRGEMSHFVMNIKHKITSSIPRVGLQLWRAELVLADFLLHKMFTSSELDGTIAIELGAGTGFVGILLARVAKTVFITDHGEEILDNCEKNVLLNDVVLHPSSSVYVRELDWNCSWPPQHIEDSKNRNRHGWTASEIEVFRKASILAAADVIYSDDLTDAFFSTIQTIMSDHHHHSDKVLYVALEKRYNFSLDDLDVVANGYSRFRSYITEKNSGNIGSSRFIGEVVDLTEIPHYVKDYDRGHDVELWQITYH